MSLEREDIQIMEKVLFRVELIYLSGRESPYLVVSCCVNDGSLRVEQWFMNEDDAREEYQRQCVRARRSVEQNERRYRFSQEFNERRRNRASNRIDDYKDYTITRTNNQEDDEIDRIVKRLSEN